MKEELKDKFNSIKTNVKNTWDKVTEDDKSKLKQDIKDRNYSGAINTAKDNFQKNGKV
jgi:uncharacterized protein YjbJ (UPF0337 family)